MSTRFFSPRSADLHADLNLNVSVKAVFVLNARTTIHPAASNTRILFFIYIYSHTLTLCLQRVCAGTKHFKWAAAVGDLISCARRSVFRLKKTAENVTKAPLLCALCRALCSFRHLARDRRWCKMCAGAHFASGNMFALEKSLAARQLMRLFNCKCFSLLLLFRCGMRREIFVAAPFVIV